MGRPPRDEVAGVTLAVKVPPPEKTRVVEAAARRHETASDLVRTMIAYAFAYMPPDWRPGDPPVRRGPLSRRRRAP